MSHIAKLAAGTCLVAGCHAQHSTPGCCANSQPRHRPVPREWLDRCQIQSLSVHPDHSSVVGIAMTLSGLNLWEVGIAFNAPEEPYV